MISIFRPTHKLVDYGFLQTDMHSHILPGIDDGAKDVEESITLLKGLKELGFEQCLATPHISQEHYPNTPATIQNSWASLTSDLGETSDINVKGAAAEYLLDEHFPSKIEGGKLLTLPDNRVLFELSFASPPRNLEDVIFALRMEGYRPVLAHPERYRYWSQRKEEWTRMISLGCELQVNILSLLGYYGKRVRKNAYEILERKEATFLGSDCHNLRHIKALQEGLKDRQFAKAVKSNNFDNRKLTLQ